MKLLLAFVLVAPLAAADLDISDKFYNAIRNGDAAAVQQLVKSGADVNGKDRRGGTPLLYAAAVGTPQIMRILIDAGADVNASTSFGATPLLWGAANGEKVRLLVEKGAEVNARSKNGNTPLLIAAAQSGNADVVRFLLAHGASLADAQNDRKQTPLLRAARTNDLAMVKLLLDSGEDVKARDALGATPLFFAATEGNVAMMKLLLAKGADVNAQTEPHALRPVKNGPLDIGQLSPLMVAAGFSRNAAAVRLLLDAGANVNAQDVRGLTPLMLAVASDHADPEIVRMLLKAKPDVTLKSKDAETALAWAGKFQHPRILPEVKEASASLPAGVLTPVEFERSHLTDVRQAAEKSLALVQKTTATFLREGGCVSCHSQHIVGMAASVARAKGVRLDEAAAAEVLRANRLDFGSRTDLFLEREDGPADVIISSALLALAFQDVPADRMTDAMVRSLASQQMPDGHWSSIGIVRPPTGDGHLSRTAASIRSLRQYGPPALKDEMNERIARATAWLLHAESTTTEDAVMQLLGAKWGGADAATLSRLTRVLLDLQRSGGGWAQTPHLPPDAYATSTALYALYEGGGISPRNAVYQRGVHFLLNTQAADGSWHVVSRSPKFQPYFDSGFPYGHDQWISQWATGWSTMALALAVPENLAER